MLLILLVNDRRQIQNAKIVFHSGHRTFHADQQGVLRT